MAFDILIKNGRIVDGSGMPSFVGDVGIRGGKILEVGAVSGEAGRLIDAEGLAVSPGFIDHHTHLDAQLLWDPLGTSSCWHGVTTVVTSNCSLALAPCKPEDRDALVGTFVRVEAMSRKALEQGIEWEWTTIAEYLDRLDRRLGLNVAAHIGHSALRQFVLGEASSERAATAAEIGEMKQIMREALAAGAIGFTTNQNPNHVREDGRPIPSGRATREEILELVSVLREFNTGVIEIHPGTLGVHLATDAGMNLFFDLARASRRPILWIILSHRWQMPTQWQELLEMAERGFREGLQAYGLTSSRPIAFRFTLKNAQVFDGLPAWRPYFVQASAEERLEAFRDPEVRRRLQYDAVEDPTPRSFSKRWDLVYVKDVKLERHRGLVGKSVAEIARMAGKPIVDAFFDLALEEGGDTLFETVLVNGDDQAVARILTSPYTLIGLSDAGAHTIFDAAYGYCTELLGRWVRDKGIMTLEEAVRKLTLVPASIFGFYDRGLLRPGMAADITVFDPATVRPLPPELAHDYPAGEGRLIQRAEGIHYTIVNGDVLTEHGRHTGSYPGRVLRNWPARQARQSSGGA